MIAADEQDANRRCSADRLLDLALSVISIPNPDIAGTWSRVAAVLGRQALEAALTRFWVEVEPACHHQAYELSPTAAELDSWLNDIKAFAVITANTPKYGGGPEEAICVLL